MTKKKKKKEEEKNQKTKNKKWKTNQSTKINLIGCDTIVNSPSLISRQINTKVLKRKGMESFTKTNFLFKIYIM